MRTHGFQRQFKYIPYEIKGLRNQSLLWHSCSKTDALYTFIYCTVKMVVIIQLSVWRCRHWSLPDYWDKTQIFISCISKNLTQSPGESLTVQETIPAILSPAPPTDKSPRGEIDCYPFFWVPPVQRKMLMKCWKANGEAVELGWSCNCHSDSQHWQEE